MFWEILKASKGLPTTDLFAALWGKKIYDANQWQITTLTGSLPLTYESRVEHILKNYALYGSASGAGVETENLTDPEQFITGRIDSGRIRNQADTTNISWNSATNKLGFTTSKSWRGVITQLFENLRSGDTYTCSLEIDAIGSIRFAFYDENGVWLNVDETFSVMSGATRTYTVTVPEGASKLRIASTISTSGEHYLLAPMLVKSDTAPASYAPYGYQIPLTITSGTQSQDYPLYIGSTKLGEEEYLDYESGKVYKRTANLWNPEMEVLGRSIIKSNGTPGGGYAFYSVSDYIPLEAETAYIISPVTTVANASAYHAFYDSNKEVIGVIQISSANQSKAFTTPANCAYMRFTFREESVPANTIMLVQGDTLPETFTPYLQPTDPPVSLPAISAYKGENTLSSTETLGETIIKGRIRKMTYLRVEYLKSTGTQYIQTDIVPSYSYKSELRIKFGSEIHQIENNDYTYIFGISGAAALGVYCAQLDGNSGNIMRFRDGYYSTDTSITGINPVVEDTLIMNRPTSFYGNASLTTNAAIESLDPPVEPIIIFGLIGVSAGNKRIWPFKKRDMFLYEFKIYDSNDSLLHDLIPVERKGGELGLLDTITNKFYANAGTGTFEKGDYI